MHASLAIRGGDGVEVVINEITSVKCEGQPIELVTPALLDQKFLMTKKYGKIELRADSAHSIRWLVTPLYRYLYPLFP